MEKFKNKYKIESIRLKGWNYANNGYYFVTICTKDRICCFGEIINDKMILSQQGKIIQNQWLNLPNHYHNCILDAFIIMPNHVHGIIIIDNQEQQHPVEMGFKPISTATKPCSLSEIIRGFKTFSSKHINILQNTISQPFWQVSFYDRIIRDENELLNVRKYIQDNPLKWNDDRNNPKSELKNN